MANVSLKILEFRKIKSRQKYDKQADMQIDYLLWHLYENIHFSLNMKDGNIIVIL